MNIDKQTICYAIRSELPFTVKSCSYFFDASIEAARRRIERLVKRGSLEKTIIKKDGLIQISYDSNKATLKEFMQIDKPSRKETVIKLLSGSSGFATFAVAKRLGLTRSSARWVLLRLLESGVINRTQNHSMRNESGALIRVDFYYIGSISPELVQTGKDENLTKVRTPILTIPRSKINQIFDNAFAIAAA